MLSITAILSTILLGTMLFFAFIVAPSIHKSLDDDEALTFSRYLFPRYFLCGIVLSGLGIIFSVLDGSYTFILLIVILLGFAYSRQILLPKISKAKDQWTISESPQDKTRYKSLHRRSVIINATQIILLVIIVVATQQPWNLGL